MTPGRSVVGMTLPLLSEVVSIWLSTASPVTEMGSLQPVPSPPPVENRKSALPTTHQRSGESLLSSGKTGRCGCATVVRPAPVARMHDKTSRSTLQNDGETRPSELCRFCHASCGVHHCPV
jgi:hypothetical protein